MTEQERKEFDEKVFVVISDCIADFAYENKDLSRHLAPVTDFLTKIANEVSLLEFDQGETQANQLAIDNLSLIGFRLYRYQQYIYDSIARRNPLGPQSPTL